MDICVRCFLLDSEDRILLVKHGNKLPWVLPGGHVEDIDTTIYDTLKREINEELGIDILILGVENQFDQKGVRSLPLPVSIHTVRYEHKTRGIIEKFEYVFFARAKGEIDEDSDELVATKRMEMDEILALDDEEIPPFIKQILDQNIDFLDVLG